MDYTLKSYSTCMRVYATECPLGQFIYPSFHFLAFLMGGFVSGLGYLSTLGFLSLHMYSTLLANVLLYLRVLDGISHDIFPVLVDLLEQLPFLRHLGHDVLRREDGLQIEPLGLDLCGREHVKLEHLILAHDYIASNLASVRAIGLWEPVNIKELVEIRERQVVSVAIISI